MKIVQYFDIENLFNNDTGFCKVEHEGKCLATFDGPYDYAKARAFLKGWYSALNEPLPDWFPVATEVLCEWSRVFYKP